MVDRRLGRLALDWEEVLAGGEAEALAVAGYGDQCPEAGVVRAFHSGEPAVGERVAGRLDRLPRP